MKQGPKGQLRYKEKYNRRTSAEKETLKNFFEADWFDDDYEKGITNREKTVSSQKSANEIMRCQQCGIDWNLKTSVGGQALNKIRYWGKSLYKNIPKQKKTCPRCKKK